jgi:hypothetical protein
VTAQRGREAARSACPGRAVAGIAVFVAIMVITVLMVFDPHLTYRGSADLFFFLIALTVSRDRPGSLAAAHRPAERALTEVRS